MFDFWGHVVVSDTEINQSYLPVAVDTGKMNLNQIRQLSSADLDQFLRDGYWARHSRSGEGDLIRSAQRFILFPGILQIGQEYEGIQIKGIDVDFNPVFYDKYLIEGEPLEVDPSSFGRGLMISEQTADRLQVSVGDQMVVYFVLDGNQITRRLEVSSIYRTGLEEYDQKVAFTDINLLRQVLKWDKESSSGVEFFLNDIAKMEPFATLILQEIIPLDYHAMTLRSRFPAIFEWLELQDYNKYVIIGLMLIVCVFNLMTTALILVLERTNMIGVMKTLGMPDRQLRMIFVFFSFRILVISALIGNAVGLALCYIQKEFGIIRLNEADYYLSQAPIYFDWPSFIAVNLILMVIIFLVLLLPSSLVQRISPVQAIRLK